MHKPLSSTCSSQIVLRRIADLIRRTISHVDHRTIGGTHHGLSPSILIPVVGDDVLFVVLEVGHVRPEVYPPELPSVEFIHLYNKVLALVACLRIVCRGPALVIKLKKDLQFAVAVNIGTTGVIGYVCRLQVSVVWRNLQIVLCPYGGNLRMRFLRASNHGGHCVLTVLIAP